MPAEILAEEGLIGFSLFVAFICAVFHRAKRVMFSPDLETDSRVHFGILAAIFSFECILMLKQSSMLGSVRLFCVGMTIAWLGDRMRGRARKHKHAKHRARMQLLVPPLDQMAPGG